MRAFIPNFSKLTHPMQEALKEPVFKWTHSCAVNFEEIKKILTSEPCLANCDPSKEVYIVTDASRIGFGAALLQKDEKEHFKVVSYTSKFCDYNQRAWSSPELELAGVAHALKTSHEYVYQHKVIIFSDNISLKIFTKFRNATLRFAKITQDILQYDFEIKFVRGKAMNLADYLSRNIAGMDDKLVYVDEEEEEGEEEVNQILQVQELDFNILKEMQKEDTFCGEILKAIEIGEHKDRKIKRLSRQFEVKGGILVKKVCPEMRGKGTVTVLPKKLILEVLEEYHAGIFGGHLGKTNLILKVKEKYYFPDFYKICEEYVKTCQVCTKNKGNSGKKPGYSSPPEVPVEALSSIYIDVCGPFAKSRHQKAYLVNMIDQTTRYIYGVPVAAADAKTIAGVIFGFICRFGILRELHCDQGTEFKNGVVKELAERLNIQLKFSVPHCKKIAGSGRENFLHVSEYG